MPDLIVVGFGSQDAAEDVLLKLAKLQNEYLVDLEDAVVAIRDENGKIHLKQSFDLTALGASSGLISGALWGGLVGLLLLNPLAGFTIGGLVGAGTGALSGSLADYGINDDFIRSPHATAHSSSGMMSRTNAFPSSLKP